MLMSILILSDYVESALCQPLQNGHYMKLLYIMLTRHKIAYEKLFISDQG